MSTTAMIFMVAICGFVWGGFGVLLVRAVRREGQKKGTGETSHSS